MNKMTTTTTTPTEPGRYTYNRATGTYTRDATTDYEGNEIGADLCRHPDREHHWVRVFFAGAAARAPASIAIDAICAQCEDELRERAASDDGGAVWATDALPVLSVENME